MKISSAFHAPLDFDGINAAALAVYPGLLQQWFPQGRVQSGEFKIGNANGDPGKSLSVNIKTGVWSDFASDEGGSDPISLYAAHLGLTQGEAAKRLADELRLRPTGTGGARMASDEVNIDPNGNQNTPSQDWRPILPAPVPRPDHIEHPRPGKPSAVWIYKDAEGQVLFLVCRFDPPGGKKEILPLTYGSLNGREGWHWKSAPKPRPLYGLDELSRRPDARVLIVEGEKCVHAARRLLPAAVAVTWPGGCKAIPYADWSALKDKEVWYWRDADPEGDQSVAVLAKRLHGLVKGLRILVPPEGTKKGWDAADALAEGWDTARLTEHMKDSMTNPFENVAPMPLPAAELVEQTGTEPPQPLMRELPPPEPYPVDALGSILGAAAEAIHDITQAPVAICAQSVLAAASLATQTHADIQLPTGHERPVSNFYITIAETGERKTACDLEALWPIRKRERQLREEYDADLERWQNDQDAWESQRRQILGNKTDFPDRATKKAALGDLGPAPLAPLTPMLTCTEPTFEGLAKLYMKGHPSLGVFAAEGGQFIGGHGMSEENKLRTATALSSLWDGEPIKRVRAGDGASTLPGRRLSAHLMVQPGVASVLLTDSILADQGLLSRILVTAPEPASGKRMWREPNPESSGALRRYGGRLLDILETPPPLAENKHNELAPRLLCLSGEARQGWIAFADHIEKQIAPGGNLSPIKGLANKLAEHAARIAGVLALADDLQAPAVTGEHLAAGIEIAQHYAGEALRLHEAGRGDPDLLLAQTALDWLLAKWPHKYIGLSDLYRLGPNPIRNAKTARHILYILEDHSWVFRLKAGATVDGQHRREAWHITRP